jgi:hypothetical protein
LDGGAGSKPTTNSTRARGGFSQGGHRYDVDDGRYSIRFRPRKAGGIANWHPHLHLHLLVTDGGFRRDGTFVSWPAHDTARLTEAFRRAVLRLFVRLALFDEDQAAGMMTWPHSGFHVHTAVWEGPFGCPRTIARSRRASRGTVRGIPSRWNG